MTAVQRYVVTADGCWEWQGSRDPDGYGTITINGITNRAYRVAYQLFIGAIPARLVLDHLCRNRACINPEHLEPVTNRENVLRGESLAAKNLRKTHCPQGHEFDDANTYIAPGGTRRGCRTCRNEASLKSYARSRARHQEVSS